MARLRLGEEKGLQGPWGAKQGLGKTYRTDTSLLARVGQSSSSRTNRVGPLHRFGGWWG
jgi:hypothetical protein